MFFVHIRITGIVCEVLSIIIHLIAIILTSVLVFRKTGIDCMLRDEPYNSDGDSFEKDGFFLKLVLVSQFILQEVFDGMSCVATVLGTFAYQKKEQVSDKNDV